MSGSGSSKGSTAEIKFIDRFKTLRRIRDKAHYRLPPPEEAEIRYKLQSQAELASSFQKYLQKLEGIYTELQRLHTEFTEKLEKPGLNPEAWPELPHNAMYSFKITIGKLAQDVTDMWRGSLDRLVERFETCQTTLEKTDELAWHDMRYEQKLNGLYKTMQGVHKSKKILRNEEKRRIIQQEHKVYEERLAEQMGDLTTKQREEEQNQICILMDSYCKNLQDFGVGLSETRRHIKTHTKAGPKGWEGFLTRQLSQPSDEGKWGDIPTPKPAKKTNDNKDNKRSNSREKSKFEKSREEWEEKRRIRSQKNDKSMQRNTTNPFNDDVPEGSSTSSDSDEPKADDRLKKGTTNPFSAQD